MQKNRIFPRTPRQWLLGVALALSLGVMSFDAAATPSLDVNTATVAELDGLRGVGPALSGRVLAARQEGGPFRDWADLVRRVKGIGARSAARLSGEGLTVNGLPFAAPLSKE
ncbi:MAG: hypothetical protein JWQ03_882 [Variovorax sp.]|nr:hypothetical protein [Variovorax sp.]